MSNLRLITEHPAFLSIEDAFSRSDVPNANRAMNILLAEGYTLLGELCLTSENNLYRLPNFGSSCLAACKQVLLQNHMPDVGSNLEHISSIPVRDVFLARLLLNALLPSKKDVPDAVMVAPKVVKPRRKLDRKTRVVEAAVKAFAPGMTEQRIADFRMLVAALVVSQENAAQFDMDFPEAKPKP